MVGGRLGARRCWGRNWMCLHGLYPQTTYTAFRPGAAGITHPLSFQCGIDLGHSHVVGVALEDIGGGRREQEREEDGLEHCAWTLHVRSRCSETARALARHSGAQILQCRAARVPFSVCALDVSAGCVRLAPQSRSGAGAPGTSASTLRGSTQMRRCWGAAPTTAASQGAARRACGDTHRIWGGASGAPKKAHAHE
ncbi:hypothetical protein B0H14DRAFT_2785288 [Mycena olivaceomarginata]|nr:hypothetical protein B0H14DRAFT_2822892 [Mycena olivaceomarginata]KAJ7840266.1 hypothetical protein B0H14DRAFT_2785288 [Mycena olivaceomarginata]